MNVREKTVEDPPLRSSKLPRAPLQKPETSLMSASPGNTIRKMLQFHYSSPRTHPALTDSHIQKRLGFSHAILNGHIDSAPFCRRIFLWTCDSSGSGQWQRAAAVIQELNGGFALRDIYTSVLSVQIRQLHIVRPCALRQSLGSIQSCCGVCYRAYGSL
jgi:hypothetical protein